MFILENVDQLKDAIERAKKDHPSVRMDKFGRYFVTSADKKTFYTVFCGRMANTGQKFVSCDCQAGLHGRVCKHAAAALPLHIFMAKQRASTASA